MSTAGAAVPPEEDETPLAQQVPPNGARGYFVWENQAFPSMLMHKTAAKKAGTYQIIFTQEEDSSVALGGEDEKAKKKGESGSSSSSSVGGSAVEAAASLLSLGPMSGSSKGPPSISVEGAIGSSSHNKKGRGSGKKKNTCSAKGCSFVAIPGGTCKKHGGGWGNLKCSVPGCGSKSQSSKGMCGKHGRGSCIVNDCTHIVHSHGRCRQHTKHQKSTPRR